MAASLAPRAPRILWTSVVEAKPESLPGARPGAGTVFTGGPWTLITQYRTRYGNWRGGEHHGDYTPYMLDTMIQSRPPKTPIWLVVPRLSEWMVLSGAWGLMELGKLWIPDCTNPGPIDDGDDMVRKYNRPGLVATGGGTELLIGQLGATPINIVGVGNYYPGSVVELLHKIASPEAAKASRHTENGRYKGYTAAVAQALHGWLRGLIASWVEEGLGPWRHTASQLSHSAGRRVYGPKAYTPTDRPEARLIERDACYGGRAEVFNLSLFAADSHSWESMPEMVTTHRLNTIFSPVFRWDIRSCYPWIVGKHPAPCKLINAEYDSVPVSHVDADMNMIQAAVVRIGTNKPAYPVRSYSDPKYQFLHCNHFPKPKQYISRHRTIFPVGEFTTTLAGKDLANAARDGHILQVHNLLTYSTTMAFQGYMEICYGHRIAAKACGDEIRESLWKLLGNSFLGKFAANAQRWKQVEAICDDREHKYWMIYEREAAIFHKYRSIAGVVQEFSYSADNKRAHPILWAWATSMARQELWRYMNEAGMNNIIQVDTDGIFVNAAGHANLQKIAIDIHNPKWGELRFVGEFPAGRFYGPKHYWLHGDGWTLAGVPDGFTLRNGNPSHAYQSHYNHMPLRPPHGHAGRVVKMQVVPSPCPGRAFRYEDRGLTSPYSLPLVEQSVFQFPPPPDDWLDA